MARRWSASSPGTGTSSGRWAGKGKGVWIIRTDRTGIAGRRSYEGDIWARRGSAPGTTDHVWTVFSADGSGVRHVLLPDIVLRDVRDGLAYGTRSNELDVETVVVYDVG